MAKLLRTNMKAMLFRPIAACLGIMLVLPHAALAQDTPRLCVAAAEIETGPVDAMSDFAGGVLIGADRGLFLAGVADGKVTVTSAGHPDTGPVRAIHTWQGGAALIGGGNGIFLAREAGGAITFADLLDVDTGRVEHLRDLAGAGVLIGAENGLFLAREMRGTVVRIDVDSGRVRETFDVPGGGVLVAAEKGLFFAHTVAGKVSATPVALVAPLTDNALRPLRSMRPLPGGGVLIEGYVWLLAREQPDKAFDQHAAARKGAH